MDAEEDGSGSRESAEDRLTRTPREKATERDSRNGEPPRVPEEKTVARGEGSEVKEKENELIPFEFLG
jgi:hypothetical protein